MMGILNEYRHWFNKSKLPVLDFSESSNKRIKEELKLIQEKKSKLSARSRKAVMIQAIKRGLVSNV